jgi:hypothetical protein
MKKLLRKMSAWKAKRVLPSWVVWDEDKNEYRVDTSIAYRLYLKAMGKEWSDMDPDLYHACRRGVANYVAKRAPTKGAIRLLDSGLKSIADQQDANPSMYREHMSKFIDIVKGR